MRPRPARIARLSGVLVGALLVLSACTGDEPEGSRGDDRPAYDEALRDELLTMAGDDQAERRGEAPIDDTARVARLREIVAEHGWPTYDLVGRDGADAAWLIAQHADLQPDFQAEALRLLADAVADGQGSPGNLAYLTDRVAVAERRPQTYGTQMRCTRRGPVPRTPIADRVGVDQRRLEAGLPTLADYRDEMRAVCAAG